MGTQAQTSNKTVIGTTTMIADMAQNIAGDKLQVISLMPVGGDPHLYDPVPQDAKTIADAGLILKNGLLLEGWLNKLIDNSGTKAPVITVSEGVEAIRSTEYHGSPDPHAWMDATNGIIYAENIKKALSDLAPEHAQHFQQNFDKYKQQLLELDKWIFEQVNKIPEDKRILVTSHDAFRYYGNRYGLRVESALGTSTDADVQISDINNLLEVIKDYKLPAIFVESTINPKLLQQISQDLKVIIGGKLFADSLGDEVAATYLEMLRHNTLTIVAGLTHEAEGVHLNYDILWFVLIIFALFIAAFILVAAKLRVRSEAAAEWKNYKIEIKGLTVSYERKTALTNIYLDIEPGKLYGLIGPNGAGKSTLFKAILGLITTDAGKIVINGLPVEKVRKEVAYIPQKDEIDWHFPATVEDIVLMGRYPHQQIFRPIQKKDRQLAEEAMDMLDIKHLRDKQIGELSGGQQQRVFIARALCQGAEIYLFDEPFVGVDITTEEKIVEILKSLAVQGKTILVIHHDLSEVQNYFDRVIMLNQRLIAAGETGVVFTDENIKKTYSGQLTILQEAEGFL